MRFAEEEIVYVFMPARTTGEEWKLQRPHDGPFRITQLWPTGAEVVSLKHRASWPIQVALDRLQRCPEELAKEVRLQVSEKHVMAPDMPEKSHSTADDSSGDAAARLPGSTSRSSDYRARLHP